MKPRSLSILAGSGYLVIFVAAIFANFFMLEALRGDPLLTIQDQPGMVRAGILAFMITVVFDVVVAWALQELFKDHPLSKLSTYFRMMHAAIMGVAVAALPATLSMTSVAGIKHQVDVFNITWLIGLFFFGIHLVLLSRILGRPKWISVFLVMAGVMYMVDTAAHIMLPDYESMASVFLALVAIPSIFGEMALSVWLLSAGGKAGTAGSHTTMP